MNSYSYTNYKSIKEKRKEKRKEKKEKKEKKLYTSSKKNDHDKVNPSSSSINTNTDINTTTDVNSETENEIEKIGEIEINAKADATLIEVKEDTNFIPTQIQNHIEKSSSSHKGLAISLEDQENEIENVKENENKSESENKGKEKDKDKKENMTKKSSAASSTNSLNKTISMSWNRIRNKNNKNTESKSDLANTKNDNENEGKNKNKLKNKNKNKNLNGKDNPIELSQVTLTAQQKQKHRPSVSKYDFVKVRVYLSDEHYYVLSRFLISRMLTATQVNYIHAVRIALNLKKRLVDRNELELTQKKMEKDLFDLMKEYKYNEKNIVLYKLISGFHHERIPLIILLGGPRCVGKSTLATQLAERLNLPNVIKTDTVYDLMCSILKIPEEDRASVWFRNCSNDELIERYTRECELVKKGLEADLRKCFMEGKSIIIEGTHITHDLYDYVLECMTKYNISKKVNEKNNNNNLNSTFSSKLFTVNHNPCSGVVVPFYLDMKDRNAHREFLCDRIITEALIHNQNNSEYFPIDTFSQNPNIANSRICEFESRIDLINQIFKTENKKRQGVLISSGESKAFKNINVDTKSFFSTLNTMHTEVLNKLQEIFNVDE